MTAKFLPIPRADSPAALAIAPLGRRWFPEMQEIDCGEFTGMRQGCLLRTGRGEFTGQGIPAHPLTTSIATWCDTWENTSAMRTNPLSHFAALAGILLFSLLPATLSADTLQNVEGRRILSEDGVVLGTITDCAVAAGSDRCVGLVVRYGGVLGFGTRTKIVPRLALEDRGVPNTLHLDLSAKEFHHAPTFSISRDRPMTDMRRVAYVYRYYRIDPDFPLGTLSLASQETNKSRPAVAARDPRMAVIRQRIAADPALSPLARKIEVETVGAKIVIRGRVQSPPERCRIMVHAQNIAGWQDTTDMMHVEPMTIAEMQAALQSQGALVARQ